MSEIRTMWKSEPQPRRKSEREGSIEFTPLSILRAIACAIARVSVSEEEKKDSAVILFLALREVDKAEDVSSLPPHILTAIKKYNDKIHRFIRECYGQGK